MAMLIKPNTTMRIIYKGIRGFQVALPASILGNMISLKPAIVYFAYTMQGKSHITMKQND